ncbi:MAG: TonB-dependent receptor, partial [Xanthomonadales bacterium]|nr:TonB-dependent receptor [Xanthomonadales bacterium]
ETEDDGTPVTDCGPEELQAPSGQQLPITPEFKGNLIGRYNFDMGSLQSYVQGALVYEAERTSDLRTLERDILGDLPSYTTFDASFGFGKDNWTVDLFLNNAFDERGQVSRFSQCREEVCGEQVYVVPIRPRMFGVRWTQTF